MPNPSITRGQGTARLRDLVLGEGPRTGPGAIALSLSILRFLYRMRGYPLNYLFVPDAEIWQAQALSWAGLIG